MFEQKEGEGVMIRNRQAFEDKVKREGKELEERAERNIVREKDTSVSYEMICWWCRGTEVVKCPICWGSGKTKCRYCYGSGAEICTYCWGSGRISSYLWKTGYLEECGNCGAQGSVTCRRCGGSGEVGCNRCWGYGYMECEYCRGV